MQKSQPAKILLQKLWKRSSSWIRLCLNPAADLQEKKTLTTASFPVFNDFSFFIPFNDPDETEEEVPHGGQQVRQRQIISDVGEVDFVHAVVAVEKIGLLQKALQTTHSEWVKKRHSGLSRETDNVGRLTSPESRSVIYSW